MQDKFGTGEVFLFYAICNIHLSITSSLPAFAALRSYCPQLTAIGSPPCYCCDDPETASRLEATVRKTQSRLASCNGDSPRPSF